MISNESNNHGFGRAIIVLVSGSLIAQVIALLFSPILSRLYTPEQQGVYTLLQSFAAMFSMVLSLRFDMVIISEKEDENVYPLVSLSFIICFVMSILVSIGSAVYLYIKQIEQLSIVVGVIFILMQCLLTGSINILTAYNNRIRQFKIISSTYAIRTSVQNLLMALLGFVKIGFYGMLIGSTVGLISGVGTQAKTMREHRSEIIRTNVYKLKEVSKKYWKQVIFSSPAAFLNGFFYTGLNIIIEMSFGTSVLGLYSYAYRFLALPGTLISANISKVFMEQASREWDEKGEFFKSYKTTVCLVGLVCIPIWLCFTFLAPPLFSIVFGKEWADAGIYASELITMFCIRMIAGCVAGASIIASKQSYDLIIQLMLAFFLVVMGIISVNFEINPKHFFNIINITSSIIYVAYIFLFGLCARGNKKRS